MEIHAPASGVVEYRCAAGDEVPVGATICEIFPGGRVPEPAKEKHAAQNGASPAAVENLPPARLTPLALRIAAECGVDINSFPQGTLVRQNDVLRTAGKLAPEVPAKPQRQTRQKAEPEKESPLVTGVPVEWADLSRRKLLEGKILGGGQAGSIQSSVTCLCRAPKLRARVDSRPLARIPWLFSRQLACYESIRSLMPSTMAAGSRSIAK
jgi:pyruvate/2-oxoglutarate dehydrogenase complex dihydrolipoamide acyltransferase (E2) component